MSQGTGSERRTGSGGYAELLRTNGAFRLLWFAQIASLFGDWFNIIASASLLAQLTGAGAALGGLFAIRMLGAFVASPFAGVLADRFNRKRILIVTDVLRAVVVLGFLLVRTPNQVWLLFVLTAVQMGISGVFYPVRVAILPEVATRRMLGAANALTAATWSTLLAVGAAIGGLFAGVFGIQAAFVVDAATYGLSAILLARMPYAAAKRSGSADGQPVRLASTARAGVSAYADGMRYLWRHQRVLAVALQKAFLLFFFSGFQVASVAIAGTAFAVGQGGGIALGLLFAAGGVGSGVSPVVARWLIGDNQRAMRRAMLAGYATTIAAMALAAPLSSFTMVMIGSALRGIGGGLVWVFSTQLLLEIVPEELRGRVIATEHAVLTLLGAAGSAGVGAVLEWASIPAALWIMAALAVAPTLHWAAVGVRGAAGPDSPAAHEE